jgi:rhodanese-related sulfurtransferase
VAQIRICTPKGDGVIGGGVLHADRTCPKGSVRVSVSNTAALGPQQQPVGVDAIVETARLGAGRLGPHETLAALARGALVVDTRTETQRAEQGDLPGVLVIDRTVLEWRLDPRSDARIPEATSYDLEVVVLCRQGYSSSLAAASLRALGLWRATDLIGGVEAWQAAGLPFSDVPADVRR